MASILKVDQLQKTDGSVPTASDLGVDISGTVLQQVMWQQNTPQNSVVGSYTDLAGAVGTFTPKAANSTLHIEFVFHAYVYPSAGAWESLSGRILAGGMNISASADTYNYGSAQYSTTAGIRQMDYVTLSAEHQLTSADPIEIKGQVYSYQGNGAQVNQYGTGYLRVTEIAQ